MPPKKTVATPIEDLDLTTVEGLKALLRSKVIKINEPIHEGFRNATVKKHDITLLENLMFADHDVTEESALLLSRKASTRIGDPLAIACRHGQIGAMKNLLASGAAANGNGGSKSEGLIPLHEALRAGEKADEAVLVLLGEPKINIAKKNAEKMNVFHLAANVLGSLETEDEVASLRRAVDALCVAIETREGKGRNFINARDENGETALMLMAPTGDAVIIQRMIKCGASRTLKNPDGQTAVDLFVGSDEDKKAAFKRVYKGRAAVAKPKKTPKAKKAAASPKAKAKKATASPKKATASPKKASASPKAKGKGTKTAPKAM